MGKIKRGILGGFSGKVANVIGGSWKGIAYMRSQPLSVSQPNTAAQLQQRSAFSNLVEIAQLLLLVYIQPLWNRLAVRQSGYNFWIQQNKLAVTDTGFSNPGQFQLSPGNATGALVDSLDTADASPNVTINWTDNSGTGTALATDVAFGLAWNQDTEEFATFAITRTRADGSQVLAFESNNSSGDTINCWLAFKSADGLKISQQSSFTQVVP